MKNFIFLPFIILFGCHNQEQSRMEMLKKRGIQEIKIGNMVLTARLLSKYGADTTDNSIIYLNIHLKRLNGDALSKEKTLYLDFDIEHDFVLLQNKDSISPVFCQRIANGQKNDFEYIVAFDRLANVSAKELDFLYNDKLFGIGTVAFVYNLEELKKIQA